MRPVLQLVSAASAAAAVLALAAGCGGDSITIPTGEGNVKVGSDGGEYKIETDDGSFVSGAGLPAGFPDDVPLVEGKVLSGSALDSGSGKGFTVALESPSSAQELTAEVTSQFEEAGYKSVSTMSSDGTSILGFESPTWTVVVGINAGEPSTLSYTIAASDS